MTEAESLHAEIIAAGLSAATTGIWEWDLPADRVKLLGSAADFYGFTASEGEVGVTQEALTSRVHMSDRAARARHHRRYVSDGGYFVLSYRTVPEPGRVRSLLFRGRFYRGNDGIIQTARGIAIGVPDALDDSTRDLRALAGSMPDPQLRRSILRIVDAIDEFDREEDERRH